MLRKVRTTAFSAVLNLLVICPQLHENWKFHKPRVASYWLVKLDSIKRRKVIDIVRSNVRAVLQRTWKSPDVDSLRLYRIFSRVFNRLLWSHGQGLWNCFQSSGYAGLFYLHHKKVLLRERKRHTARRVVSTHCTAAPRWIPTLAGGGGGLGVPTLARGVPKLARGVSTLATLAGGGVPTLAGGTYPGCGVPTLDRVGTSQGRYPPVSWKVGYPPPPSMWTDTQSENISKFRMRFYSTESTLNLLAQ